MIEITLSHRAVFIPHSGLAGQAWEPDLSPVRLPSLSRPCRIAHIQALVAASYGIHIDHMKSPSRERGMSWPRQVAMYLARVVANRSMPCIGREFGGRDHTTVLHAIRAVEKRMDEDPLYRADVEALRQRLAA